MRFPLVISKRRTLDKLLDNLAQEKRRRISAEGAAARSGHKVQEALAETGKLAEELRLIRLHIDQSYDKQRIEFHFEIAHAVLIEGYRYGARGELFRQAVAHHIERAFYMNPELREFIL